MCSQLLAASLVESRPVHIHLKCKPPLCALSNSCYKLLIEIERQLSLHSRIVIILNLLFNWYTHHTLIVVTRIVVINQYAMTHTILDIAVRFPAVGNMLEENLHVRAIRVLAFAILCRALGCVSEEEDTMLLVPNLAVGHLVDFLVMTTSPCLLH